MGSTRATHSSVLRLSKRLRNDVIEDWLSRRAKAMGFPFVAYDVAVAGFARIYLFELLGSNSWDPEFWSAIWMRIDVQIASAS